MADSKQLVRLVVGDVPGPRSGMWRVWASGDDVYVAHDGMRNDMKISLHASGINRHALTEAGAARWTPDGEDRLIFKWGPPEEFGPGGRSLLHIIIPTAHLTAPEVEPPPPPKMRQLLEPAPEGGATVITIAVTDPGVRLRKPEDTPSALIAQWELPTRGTVWVVGTHETYTDGLDKAVRDALPEIAGTMEKQIGNGPLPENPLTLVASLNLGDDGALNLVEVSVEIGRRPAPGGWLTRLLTRLLAQLATGGAAKA